MILVFSTFQCGGIDNTIAAQAPCFQHEKKPPGLARLAV
jgi:hypothetical protein